MRVICDSSTVDGPHGHQIHDLLSRIQPERGRPGKIQWQRSIYALLVQHHYPSDLLARHGMTSKSQATKNDPRHYAHVWPPWLCTGSPHLLTAHLYRWAAGQQVQQVDQQRPAENLPLSGIAGIGAERANASRHRLGYRLP
jgi:hypothetical protein